MAKTRQTAGSRTTNTSTQRPRANVIRYGRSLSPSPEPQSTSTDSAAMALSTSAAHKHRPTADYDSESDIEVIFEKLEPKFAKCWNIEDAEGPLECLENGLVTAKGPKNGLIRAMESLPSKRHNGVLYFELKIIEFPKDCELLIGISQKMGSLSSFYFVEHFYELKNENTENSYRDHVIGCGINYGDGYLFIAKNGKAEKKVNLLELNSNCVDHKWTIELRGEGCSVQLGRIRMSLDGEKCPF